MGKRDRGTGHLYEKYGAYYGRWRTLDGRRLNRLIGPVRTPGESDELTRSAAQRVGHLVERRNGCAAHRLRRALLGLLELAKRALGLGRSRRPRERWPDLRPRVGDSIFDLESSRFLSTARGASARLVAGAPRVHAGRVSSALSLRRTEQHEAASAAEVAHRLATGKPEGLEHAIARADFPYPRAVKHEPGRAQAAVSRFAAANAAA